MDDMFISLRYAQNAAHGQGIAYNPGERFEGYSNFLFVLLEVGGMRFVRDPFLLAKALAFFAYTLFSIAFLSAVRAFSGGKMLLFAAVILVFDPVFIAAANLGLETSLFHLLLLLLFLMYWYRGQMRFPWWSLLAVGCILARPEGVLFVGITWIAEAWVRREWQTWFSWGHLAVLLVFLGYTGWRWEYYGGLATGPALFKGANSNFFGDPQGLIVDKLKAVALFHIYFFIPLLGTAIFVWRHVRERANFRAYLAAFALLGYLFTMVLHAAIFTDYANYYRYHGQVVPFVFLAFFLVLGDAWRLPRFRRWAMCAAILVLAILPYRVAKLNASLAAVRDRDAQYFIAGEFLKRLNCGPGEALLSVHDAGIVPFTSGLKTLDWWLNDREAATLINKRDPAGWRDYIISRRPDLFFISNYSWSRTTLSPFLEKEYAPIWQWKNDNNDLLILKRNGLKCAQQNLPLDPVRYHFQSETL